MSKKKAKEFLKMIQNDAELKKKFAGFTLNELSEAAKELKSSRILKETELAKVSGGHCDFFHEM